MNKFDEDVFDQKVSNIVTDIHYRQLEKTMEKKFHKWCQENEEHLERLYDVAISEPDFVCDFDVFCYYVFINS